MVAVTFLTSEGCTPCLRVKRILEELRSQIPDLNVEDIDFSSSVGSKLAIDAGVLYPPAVFVEKRLIAKGRIDADSLRATIKDAEPTR